jgi:hypothetical protein
MYFEGFQGHRLEENYKRNSKGRNSGTSKLGICSVEVYNGIWIIMSGTGSEI